LGTIGYAAVGTLFSAVSIHTRAREVMLPIMLFPIIVPVIIGAIKSTGIILRGQSLADLAPWLKLLLAFDVIFLVICFLLFEFVLEDQ
ncbi:MAG: heme exporter protein CcmB, partial [Thermodesulfobacteriota bacterium]